MLTVDTIFIYEFLLWPWIEFQPKTEESKSQLKEYDYFQTFCKNEITTNQILRDLFLMGNQIPMSFLMTFIEVFPSKDKSNEKDKLEKGLLYVVQQVDPFKNVAGNWKYCDEENYSEDDSSEILDFCQRSHLLDFLYVWVLLENNQN